MDVIATGANPMTIDEKGEDPILSAAGFGHSKVVALIAGGRNAVIVH